jgi:GDP-L-fucose synthase
MQKNDRIVVTGAAGLVGSALVELLGSTGYSNVVGIARDRCDLRDTRATQDLFAELKPVYVFHAAARVYGIMGNLKNKALSFYDNVLINTNVVDASHRAGVKKITVLGTGAVYPYPPPGQPFKEDMIFMGEPHHSEDSYSHAKRAMLGMLRAYEESYGTEWAYIVSCNQFGPRDRFDAENGHVVPSLIRRFYEAKQAGTDVTVWGDGTAQRDFLYVKDAAQASVEIMEKLKGPVNIGSGRVVTIREVVDLITDISGMQGRVHWDATKPNGREYLGYDLSKMASIGFAPKYSLREALQETWDWYASVGSRGRG